jgi:hypothetical protein
MRCHLALLALLPTVVACQADKRLWIESDPPGAAVRLDHVLVGTTPYEMEFVHYGTHRLDVDLVGYEPYSRELLVPAPWYARFPIDIVTEVLLPIGWKDHKVAQVTLVPIEGQMGPERLERIRARAESFRHATEDGPQNLIPLDENAGQPLVAVPR